MCVFSSAQLHWLNFEKKHLLSPAGATTNNIINHSPGETGLPRIAPSPSASAGEEDVSIV